MDRDLSIFICPILDREITIINVYINNFFLISNYFTILDILKKMFGQKYSIKDLREEQTIIE